MPTAAAVRAEMIGKVRQLAGTSTETSVKGRLRALARHLGLSPGRTAKYWYGLIPCPPAHEADQIRAYYKAAQELIEARAAYEKRRENFLRDHRNLAFVVPDPIADVAGATTPAAIVADKASTKPARPRRRKTA